MRTSRDLMACGNSVMGCGCMLTIIAVIAILFFMYL